MSLAETEDSIVANTDPRSSPATSSSSYKPSPDPSDPPSSATLPSSEPPPTPAKVSKASKSSSHPFTSTIYQVNGNEAVREWDEYISSLRPRESLFGALRGTVSERYSEIQANTARQERLRWLEEEQIRVLLEIASQKHQETCDACDDPGKMISQDCLRKTDAKLVRNGLGEILRHREYFRIDPPSKGALEVGFIRARFRGDVEVKSIINLNYLYPYMSYQPGEYLLQLMDYEEATYRQQTIGVRMEPYTEIDSMFSLHDDILIVIAILGFKPAATDLVPRTLRVLFEASSAPAETWVDLVAAWDTKFGKVSGLPKYIQHSVAEAHTKLSEAAWLILRLRGPDGLDDYSAERDSRFDAMEQLICSMTGSSFEELADQHLKQLGAEAVECLKDGKNEEVLVYSSGSWPKHYKDIHSFYRTNSGFPQPAPLDLDRLDTFRLAALRIIDNEEQVEAIRSDVTRQLFELNFLHEGDDGKVDDIPATTTAAVEEEPQLPPPSVAETPRKKRGRPPKKQGDPKAPYNRKKQKLDPASSSQPSIAS
ncbi:hypothetical protein PG991_006761 [Apiospora marii]|uniref:Uncharacterized protein n=1 Tax=Apiospora marii TaxID=335849 RepID=A0ABR1RZM3_9PEZI